MSRIEAARQIATEQHVKRGKFEIDPDCETQSMPAGVWVQAWVFVSNTAIEQVTECEEEED